MFSCSANILRKKACIAFGINSDDKDYRKMTEHLEKIKKNRELVRFV